MNSKKKVGFYAFVNTMSKTAYSGTPYYLIDALKICGVNTVVGNGLSSDLTYRNLRVAWVICRIFLLKAIGGFQYSKIALWYTSRDLKNSEFDLLINFYQLTPINFLQQKKVIYFIDQTLTQLFSCYREFSSMKRRRMEEIINLEKYGYDKAALIVVNSEWAKESMINHYGVNPVKIRVISQGANFSYESLKYSKLRSSKKNRHLRFIYVGKDYVRKNLVQVIEVLSILSSKGISLELIVIGPRSWPEDIPFQKWIDFRGIIDKNNSENELALIYAKSDIGISLSNMDAGGIALKEFQAFGMPLVVKDVGGVCSQVSTETSLILSNENSSEEMADQIYRWISKEKDLFEKAFKRRSLATWKWAAESLDYEISLL